MRSRATYLIRFGVLEEHVDDVIRTLCRSPLLQFTDFTLRKEYGDLIEPCAPSEKLYTYPSLISRINSVIQSLRIPAPKDVRPAPPEGKLGDEVVSEAERLCAKLENLRASIISKEEEIKKIKAEIKEIEAMMEELEKLREMRRVGIRRRIAELRTKLGANPEGRLEGLRSKLSMLENEKKSLEHELKELAKTQGPSLYAYREMLQIDLVFEEVKSIGGKAGRLRVFEAWVPRDKIPMVEKVLSDVTGGCYLFDVAKLEVYEEAEAPTHIDPPNYLRSWQALVDGFGVPTNYEINPSFLMLITFPVIFGFMFGDVGHGLILLVGGLYFMYLKRKGVKVMELFEPVVRGADLLLYCAISSTLVGFLFYGTLFGSKAWYKLLFGLKEPPIPLASLHEPIPLLKLSIFIGIFHIAMGLILGIVNRVKNGEIKEALTGPFTWLIFYLTAGSLFAYYCFVVGRASRFIVDMFTFDVSKLPLPFPPLLLIIGLFVLMLVVRVKFEEPAEGLGSALESFVASLSNTISYGRIFAFFLVHHSVSEIGLIGGIEEAITPMGLLSFVMATFLVVSIELLATFMQTLRLHWVEWFLKFYEGAGTPFRPTMFIRHFTKA
ncbi:MAG: V-type ATPase 116kDa subunit family protein [Candidatus Nezhaarchaeales archaeon]